jgi:tetratricopeptide (TPR) repeat protein
MKKGDVMRRRSVLLVAALFASILLVYGCGEDGDGPTPQTAAELTDQGWGKFDAGDDAGASADFNAAIGLDPEYADAYFGLGWAELRLSHAGLAENAFVTYMSMVSGSNDAEAGLALAYHAEDMFEDVINMAEAVLSADPTWSFSPHDSAIDYLDLALVLAEAYYETGDYSQSLLTVQKYFDSQFVVDPSTDQGRKQLADKLQSLYTG